MINCCQEKDRSFDTVVSKWSVSSISSQILAERRVQPEALMVKEKCTIISEIAAMLLCGDKSSAAAVICQSYPHRHAGIEKRTYTIKQKMNQFICDGFIDRYTGQKLVNPGMLKIISHYFPDEFPYQQHWKMSETHIAYWELIPTVDHIYPIARGGCDNEENWVTTSMKNNWIKGSYTIDEMHWQLYPKGKIEEWDGLTGVLITLVDKDEELLKDPYIKRWYKVSKTAFSKAGI